MARALHARSTGWIKGCNLQVRNHLCYNSQTACVIRTDAADPSDYRPIVIVVFILP